MQHIDRNDKTLRVGDVIDIHQTVNGQNLFIVMSLDPMDIWYVNGIGRRYEYDLIELLTPCKYSGEASFTIVRNIYDHL
jgi:hypothetical protein